MSPAPVMIPAYRRLEHLKLTIEALRKNTLARETVLYITSDGPRPGDEKAVGRVREFLHTVEGFGHVELLLRDHNDRLENWKFRRRLAREHGRMIYLEDDCVTSPHFLSYMNACLERFRDDERIFSISGYLPPLTGLECGPFRLLRAQRFEAWGCGIWDRSDALVQTHPSRDEFHEFIRSKELRSRTIRKTGGNIFGMLRRSAMGKLLAYDVMSNYEIVKRDLQVIFPSHSMVQNTGMDGSGAHCGNSDRYETRLYEGESLDWSEVPEDPTPATTHRLAEFYGSDLRGRLKFYSKLWRKRLDLKGHDSHARLDF